MPGRCFLAFDLPRAGAIRLQDARRAFVERAPAWAGERWVPSHQLHVTLKFIGPIDDRALPDALTALTDACAVLRAPVLRLESIRAVPSARRASMLWATFADTDGACGALASTVDEVLSARSGVPADDRAFVPHVTLVRARAPRAAPESALSAARSCSASGRTADGSMSVRSLTLYASTLGNSGPTYDSLGRVPVGTD